MDAFLIQGGARLRGRIRINGSKNAALPQLAAALLTDQPVTLRDLPNLSDTRNMCKLLRNLGCDVNVADARDKQPGNLLVNDAPDPGQPAMPPPGDLRSVTIQPTDLGQSVAKYDIVRTMRASICVLGPLLARRGEATVSLPGGCAIGDRPVDLHERGLKALGAEIHNEAGYLVAKAPGHSKTERGRLQGARIFMGGQNGSTVLGTANVMSAAVLAQGQTVIDCAACEPEIVDLAALLNAMGARIQGAGSPRIVIDGVDQLHGADHTIMADRIEAGTYVAAAAITNGDIILDNFPTDALPAVMYLLDQIGVEIETLGSNEDTSQAAGDRLRQSIRVGSFRQLRPAQITTQPHPGFPTDLQAQMMALLCFADGMAVITEKIFPERFLHVAELLRMNAKLVRTGPSVLINGPCNLVGAPVMASDLRASAGLVLAGLAAKGQTLVNRVYHLDRGYEQMEKTLQALGANIQRIDHPAV